MILQAAELSITNTLFSLYKAQKTATGKKVVAA